MTRPRLLFILIALAVVLIIVWGFKDYFRTVPVIEEGPSEETKTEESKKMDIRYLKTSDGVDIAYEVYDVLNPKKWFVLVHMMPTTKESWSNFAKLAQGDGYASIAIDLRGHGQSTGGPDGYQNFSDTDHQKSVLDIKAATDYLVKQGVNPEVVTLAGASIGANLALQFIIENPEFKRAILLSPGLNYRGIETLPLVQRLSPGQGVWFVAAEDDERSGGNAGAMAKQLYEATPADGAIERRGTVFKKGGHGTEILQAVPELTEKLIGF